MLVKYYYKYYMVRRVPVFEPRFLGLGSKARLFPHCARCKRFALACKELTVYLGRGNMYSNRNYHLLNSERARLLTCIISFSFQQFCEVDIISIFQERLWSNLLKVAQYVSDKASFPNLFYFQSPFSPSGYTPSKANAFYVGYWVLKCFLWLLCCPPNALT